MNPLASKTAPGPGYVGARSDSASEPRHKVLINTDQSLCLRLADATASALSIRVVKDGMRTLVQA
jgi:hypothetical protein